MQRCSTKAAQPALTNHCTLPDGLSVIEGYINDVRWRQSSAGASAPLSIEEILKTELMQRTSGSHMHVPLWVHLPDKDLLS